MVHDLIIDIETLGVRSNAVILSFACAAFNIEDRDTLKDIIDRSFYAKLDVPLQIKNGRKVEKSTVEWWSHQSKEARDVLKETSKDLGPIKALNMLNAYIEEHTKYDKKNSYIWSRGNAFDFPIMEDLYRENNIDIPWSVWKIRDVRTMIDVLTGSDDGNFDLGNDMPEKFVQHHAMFDAALDVLKMQKIYRLALDEKIDDGDIPF